MQSTGPYQCLDLSDSSLRQTHSVITHKFTIDELVEANVVQRFRSRNFTASMAMATTICTDPIKLVILLSRDSFGSIFHYSPMLIK